MTVRSFQSIHFLVSALVAATLAVCYAETVSAATIIDQTSSDASAAVDSRSACAACVEDCSACDCFSDQSSCVAGWFDSLNGCDLLWVGRAGAVILHRSAPSNLVLFRDATTGAPLGNANQFHFDWAAGPDVSVWRQLDPGDYLEVRYFNVTSFTAPGVFVAPGSFVTESSPPSVSPVGATINALYSSSLFSTEVNFRRQFAPRAMWLAGFRAIEVRDDFSAQADLSGIAIRSNFDINAHNFFYGAQTGLDLKLWDRGGPFILDGLCKAGVFGNAANQRTSDIARSGGATAFQVNLADRTGQAAFVGEIALAGVYRVTDRLWLRGGYQLLWIDGLALATDQLPTLNFATGKGIASTGGVFYHGAIAGAELRF